MYHHASRIAYLVTVWQTPKKISKKNTYYVMLPLSHMLCPSCPENPKKVPALLAVWDLTAYLCFVPSPAMGVHALLKRVVCAYVVSLGSDPRITHSPARITDHISQMYGRYHQLLTIRHSLLTSHRI